MMAVAQKHMKNATTALSTAIASKDMIAIQAAEELVKHASKKIEVANMHRDEQLKQRKKIGDKRKSQVKIMFTKIKKD